MKEKAMTYKYKGRDYRLVKNVLEFEKNMYWFILGMNKYFKEYFGSGMFVTSEKNIVLNEGYDATDFAMIAQMFIRETIINKTGKKEPKNLITILENFIEPMGNETPPIFDYENDIIDLLQIGGQVIADFFQEMAKKKQK